MIITYLDVNDILLENGADPNLRTRWGETAIMKASQWYPPVFAVDQIELVRYRTVMKMAVFMRLTTITTLLQPHLTVPEQILS